MLLNVLTKWLCPMDQHNINIFWAIRYQAREAAGPHSEEMDPELRTVILGEASAPRLGKKSIHDYPFQFYPIVKVLS